MSKNLNDLLNIFDRYLPLRRSHLFRKALQNASWSSADYILLPILWLFATPFFVHRLGVAEYGIWMLVNSIVGFMGVMSFGVGDATVKYVSTYRGRKDLDGIILIVRSTLTLYVTLGLITAGLAYVLAPTLIDHVFKVIPQNRDLAVAAVRVGGLGMAVRFLDGIFLSILRGYERYDLAARVNMVSNSATIFLNIALIAAGYGIIEVLLGTISVLFLSGLAKAIVVKIWVERQLRFFPTINRKAIREIFSFGFYSWLQGIASIFLRHVDRLLVASLLGTTALTYYTVCLQVSDQIHAIPAAAAAFLFPLTSAIKERGDVGNLRKIYFAGMNGTTILGLSLAIPVYLFANNILTLWMGADFAQHTTTILTILVFTTALKATSIVPYNYLNGTGFVRLNTIFSFVSGSVVAVTSFFFIGWLGIVGAAWARLSNLPTSLIGRTILHYRVLEDFRWYAGVASFAPVIFTFGLAQFLRSFMGGWPGLNLLSLLFFMAIAGAISVLISGIFGKMFNTVAVK